MSAEDAIRHIDDEIVRTIIDEAVRRALELVRVPRLLPGTVTSVVSTAEEVEVLIDGDTSSIVTTSIIGLVNPGQRVMVLFYPPSGSAIIGYRYGT